MEKKINKRMLFIGLLSMILTGSLMLTVFHKSFDKQVKNDIKITAGTLAVSYNDFKDYDDFLKYKKNGMRITLISPEGVVLFESDTDIKTMENHNNREEVILARENGVGEATRKSKTLGFNTYYYAILLNEGNVLRVSMDVKGMYADYYEAMPMVAMIGLVIIALSVVLSRMLTKSLIEPIEAMADDLDDIGKEIPYKELEPFVMAVKEQQLKKAEISKMRQEFTANVSHELKTPLTSISGYAELIENGMVKEDYIKAFAGKIHTEAGRLIDLITDILNLSELDEPMFNINFEWVDIYELIQNTAEQLSLKAAEHQVKLIIEGKSCIVMGNKLMLGELVYNLCDNAIRYNKKGGMVKMSVSQNGTNVIFTVQDNGIGISKEHHERIFERFYRVDKSRSKETGGTGLGLAIVKHIVIQHGGKISIDSQKGKGTIMKVVFEKTGEKHDNF